MRIVFCGDWDDGVKKTYKNINYKSFRMGIFVALIALVFIGISVVTSFHDDYIIFLYGIVFLALTILIGFLLLCFPALVLSNKFMNSLYSYDVIIEDTCISVEELIEKGYIERVTVKDPEHTKQMTRSVKITYASNQYSYKYQENSCE